MCCARRQRIKEEALKGLAPVYAPRCEPRPSACYWVAHPSSQLHFPPIPCSATVQVGCRGVDEGPEHTTLQCGVYSTQKGVWGGLSGAVASTASMGIKHTSLAHSHTQAHLRRRTCVHDHVSAPRNCGRPREGCMHVLHC